MDNETYTFEDGRRYILPTISRDEQLGFVNTLRDTMGRNTSQINTQTRNLGTNIPSNLGGLTGSNAYFTQRYQTMPLESQANTLKATAQAKALNDLMSNYETQMKNRANQAYRNASRRSSSASSSASSASSASGYDGVEYAEPEAYDQSSALRVGLTKDSNDNPQSTYAFTRGGYTYVYLGTPSNRTNRLYWTDDPDYYRDSGGDYVYGPTEAWRTQNGVSSKAGNIFKGLLTNFWTPDVTLEAPEHRNGGW